MLRGVAGLTRGQSQALVSATLRPAPPASFGIMYGGAVSSSTIPAADLVYLYPFPIGTQITVTSILMNLQTAGAGSAVKCAVWAQDATTGRPTGVPLLGNNTGYDTTAGVGPKSAAISNVVLPPGMYWFGSKATGTLPGMTAITPSSNASSASRIAAAAAADVVNNSGVQLAGFSVPDAYANNILALNLTGATYTPVKVAGIPIIYLGWA